MRRDGTRVAFDSRSTNPVPGDTNGRSDVFLRNLRVGITTRASVSSTGTEGNEDSGRPGIARGGAVMIFE